MVCGVGKEILITKEMADDEDRSRRARLEEIIREGRRVQSSVARLQYSSPRQGMRMQPPSSSNYNSSAHYYAQSPVVPSQEYYTPPYHQYSAPLSNSGEPPAGVVFQQSHQQYQHHQQQFRQQPNQPHQPQPHQPQPHQPQPQPHPYQHYPAATSLESKESKEAQEMRATREAKMISEVQEKQERQDAKDVATNKRLEVANSEITRLKKAMETLALEADNRITQLTITCGEQQDQIKIMVLQRTTSEAEMHQRALLENRNAKQRESETYRTLIQQLEEKHVAERNRNMSETCAKVATIESQVQQEWEEKFRDAIETLNIQHRRNLSSVAAGYKSKEKALMKMTSVLIKKLSSEFDAHRSDLANIRTAASIIQRDVDQARNSFATDLKFRLQTISHWSTGEVRVLESQLARQQHLQENTEKRKSKVYDLAADREYFERLRMKSKLKDRES